MIHTFVSLWSSGLLLSFSAFSEVLESGSGRRQAIQVLKAREDEATVKVSGSKSKSVDDVVTRQITTLNRTS